MAIFYPRKQTIFIFIISATAVMGFALYANSQKSANTATVQPVATAGYNAVDYNSQISSSTNWQKAFLENSKGSVSFKAAGTVGASSGTKTPLTATDLIARNLFSQYAQLRQSGMSTANMSDIISESVNGQILDTISLAQKENGTRTLKKIITSADNSPAAIKIYGNALGAVLGEMPQTTNEISIMKNAIVQQDISALKNLASSALMYDKKYNEIVNITTPSSLSAYHSRLSIAIASISDAMRLLQNAEADPYKGLAGIGQYATSLQNGNEAVMGIRQYIMSQGISFDPGEAGNSIMVVAVPIGTPM